MPPGPLVASTRTRQALWWLSDGRATKARRRATVTAGSGVPAHRQLRGAARQRPVGGRPPLPASCRGKLRVVFAVVITGPPGAGKSAVLSALADALSDDDIAHVAVEVETLVWTHPALTDEQQARHLQLNCELYRQDGHDLLVLAQTLETDADVAELLAAVGADGVLTVRLEAEPRTLVERITEREPAAWSGLTDLLEHTQELAVTMPALARVDLVLSTEDERPEDVAALIRAACPTQLTAPATSED